ncbi:ectoine/hydroxyectoine ABC transporter substrate-binding protein EhuB [Pseudonocardia acaciae]|uniref:ectoine/hydroxyectoine ABC transporter substrate-binding protein EhuB n=1 Tax=Pseudonocardia acaciae TaxID=551276 RepID=UPI000688B48C|nr:ectoine/hydroxyectoine ABC transporter substrate-binding protein EhuB [Pseudonocardia acaciae]
MTGRWTRRDLLRRGALASLGVASLASGCGRAAAGGTYAEGSATLARARETGIISLGIAGEVPYAYTDRNGNATGQSVELARVLLGRLGIPRVQAVTVDFGELIAGLTLARQFDMVAAGLFISPDRCRAVTFSIPDYTAPTAFLVPRGNPRRIADFEQVRDQGLRIAVLGGAVERRYAADTGIPDARIQQLADQQALLDAVATGRADCAALTNISLRNIAAANPAAPVEVTAGFFPVINGRRSVSAGGFAFRPGETDILDAVNDQLRAVQRSGEWLTIARPFGFGPENVPGADVTTEALCAT